MTPKQCREIWRGATPKIKFNARNVTGEILLSSKEELPTLSPQILIDAQVDHSNFKLFIQKEFTDKLFATLANDITLENLSHSNAAIILEHLFTDPLQELEKLLEGKITLLSVKLSDETPRAHGLRFNIHSMDSEFEAIFVNSDYNLLSRITKLLSPFFAPEEKPFSSKSDVIIGPIELTQIEINKIQVGDLVSIGKRIEQTIEGYILRASGTYWSAGLEPSHAIINSEAKKISELENNSKNNIFVGIKIGFVDIPASDIPNIKLKDKYPIERIGNNVAHLMVDNKHIATGNLRNVSDIFCLSINELEQ